MFKKHFFNEGKNSSSPNHLQYNRNSKIFVFKIPSLPLNGCVTFVKLVLKSVSPLENGENTTKP